MTPSKSEAARMANIAMHVKVQELKNCLVSVTRFLMRSLLVMAGLLAASSAWAQNNNVWVTDVRVTNVYVHNCCGRPPYVAAVLDKAMTTGSCGDPNIVALPVTDSLAKYLYTTALIAKNTGQLANISYPEDCSATLVFRT